MHILFDARQQNNAPRSGVGEYSWELLQALTAQNDGTRYSLLTSGLKPPPPALSRLPVGHRHLSVPNKLLNLALLATGHPHLDRFFSGVDAVFMPNLNLTALRPSTPLVLTVHDLSFRIFPEFFSGRMRLWHRAVRPAQLIRQAAAVIVPSARTQRDLELYFRLPQEKISVIPHGLSPLFAPAAQAMDADVAKRYLLPGRFVLFLGTLEPRKNLSLLLAGLMEYRKASGIDLPLVIAGAAGWKSHAFRRQITRPEFRKWVRYLGYVPSQHRPSLYRLAQALLWPSLYEGFGLPPLEAMACGTPVIAAHTGALPEVCGDSALLIDPYDHHDLARSLDALFATPALAQELRARGLRAAENFTWAKSAAATQEVFRRVLGKNHQ